MTEKSHNDGTDCLMWKCWSDYLQNATRRCATCKHWAARNAFEGSCIYVVGTVTKIVINGKEFPVDTPTTHPNKIATFQKTVNRKNTLFKKLDEDGFLDDDS